MLHSRAKEVPMKKQKNETKVRRTLIRREDSERVASVGPLEIFRGSNLLLGESDDQGPQVRAYYTVAINPHWLKEGHEVELCIDGDVQIVGTEKPLEEEEDLIV